MAESFRGLTIRIGGDTSKLSQALRTANGAISQTGQELRKLNQAVKLDPGNYDLVNAQMGYMAQQAANTAMKLAQLKESFNKLGESTAIKGNEELGIDPVTLEELAAATDNAGSSLAKARTEAAQASASLDRLHDSVSKLSGDVAKLEAGRMAKALDVSSGKTSLEAYEAELRNALKESSPDISDTDLEKSVSASVQRVRELADALDFRKGEVDLENLREVFESLPDHIRPSEKEIDAFIKKAKDAKDGVAEAMDGSQFEEMREELRENLAKLDQDLAADNDAIEKTYLAQVSAELNKLDAAKARLTEEMNKRLSSETDETKRGKITEKYQSDIEAREQRYASRIASIHTQWSGAMDKAAAANDKLRANAQENFDKMSKAAKEAADAAVAGYEESYGKAASAITSLSGSDFSDANGNTGLKQIEAALDDMVEKMVLTQQEATDLYAEIERLATVFAAADDNVKLQKRVAEYKDLEAEIDKNVAMLRNMSRVMSDMNAPSEVVGRMSELTDNIEVLKSAFGSLMGTGKALEDAFAADPQNVKALELATQEYSLASLAALENVERLRSELGAFDADGIAAATDGSKSAAQQLFEASKAAEDAKNKVAEADGAVAHWESRCKELTATVQKTKDATNEATEAASHDKDRSAAIKEAATNQLKYQAILRDATKAEQEASSALDLAKQRKEYEELAAQVAIWESELDKAYEAQMRLASQSGAADVFGDSIRQAEEYGTKLDAAAARARALSEAWRLDPTNADLARAKTDALQEVADLAAKKVEKLKDAMSKIDPARVEELRKQYGSVGDAVKTTTEAAKNAKKEYDEARKSLAAMLEGTDLDGMADEIVATGNAVGANLTPEVNEARAKVIELGEAWERARASMVEATNANAVQDYATKVADAQRTAREAGSGGGSSDVAFQQVIDRIGDAARQMGQEIVESSNVIDAAYRDMRKTVQGTEEDFEKLHDAAVAFSQTHAVSADTILEMESLGGQLGVAVERLQEFGEVASNLDIATDMDAEDIALKMGQLQNVMSDFDDGDFENFSNALVRLGNNTATTESAIMNVAQRMSSVANVTSMSTSELLAWSAAIASTGQRSESAATAINNTITGIGQAVSEGGNTLEQFAQIAGMSADEFENAWKTSSSEALEAFIKGLSTLTDDSTSAIAALDAVGISSVRQETALLGLSQTIQNLDNSMTMAGDAWDGISDRWGDAGDAAREAQQKSEGFSGQLAILQNNAADLAASLGDGLVPGMTHLSSVLKVATDFLSALPAPIKTAVVETGALAVAFAAVAAAAHGLGFDNFVPQVLSLATAAGRAEAGMKLAAVATKAWSAAQAAMPVLAVVLAVQQLVAITGEFVEIANTAKQTSDNLAEAMKSVTTLSSEMSADSASSGLVTFTDVAESAREGLERLKTFSDSARESITSLAQDSTTVRAYATEIQELAAKSSLTQGEQERLVDAVQRYNDATGSAVEVTDRMHGTLNVLPGTLDEITEAYARNLEKQTYLELYNDAVKELVRSQQELEVTTTLASDASSSFGEVMENVGKGNYGALETFTALNPALAYLVSQLIDVKDQMQSGMAINGIEEGITETEMLRDRYRELFDEVSGSSTSFSQLETAMAAAGMSTSELARLSDDQKSKLLEVQNALLRAGDSLANYGALNASQLALIAAAWNGSVPQVVAALKKIQNATNSAASVGKPSDEAVTDYKRELEDSYNAAKKEADDFHKSEQKRLDKEVKAAQKAMDAEYKARQRELDAEYKAAQKASQKYLKSYKEAQAEEVEAFKAATDERVKELEREHDYKKKLLDEEYAMYDSRYDEQIAAIEAEQDAEDKAQEQRERSEKLTELQYAVDTAKSAKKREEAEKALADYKEELAAKDRKTSRQNQIQAIKDAKSSLKDQLSDRETHLKETYSLAVEQYKAERAAIQKEMAKANEIEYEQVQEAEQAKLEAIKAAHTAELESMKESQSAQLDAMKEANSEYLDSLKADADARLQALKRGNDDLLKHFKETGIKLNASLKEIMDALLKSGAISTKTYEDVMAGVPGSIEKMFGEMGLTVENGLDKVAKAMLDSGQISQQQYVDIMKGVPGALDAICNEAGVVVANQLGLLAPIMANAAKSSKEEMTSQLDELKSNIKKKAGEINDEAARIMTDTTIGGPLERTNALVGTVLGKYAEMADGMGPAVKKVNDTIHGTGGGDTAGVVSANVDKINDVIHGVGGDDTANAVASNVGKVNDIINGAGGGGTADAVSENVGRVNDIMHGAMGGDVGVAVGANVAGVNGALVATAGADVANAVGANVGNVGATIQSGTSGFAGGVAGNVAAVNQGLSGIGGGDTAGYVQANLGVVNEVVNGGTSALGANVSQRAAEANQALGGIVDQGTIDSVAGNFGVLTETVSTASQGMPADMSTLVGYVNAAISALAGGNVGSVVSANVSNAMSGGAKAIEGASQWYEESAKGVMLLAAKAMPDAAPAIEGAVKSAMAKGASDADANSRDQADVVGRNFTIGIANGMLGALQSVVNAAIQIAESALQSVKARLGVHSPSREGAKIGRFFDLGIAQGVKLNAGEVEDAASGIGDAMAGAFDPSSLRVNTDFMQSLIDDMRARENDLRAQAERMTRIVEDGFDPHVTLDAAFDAIGRIEAGRLRREQAVASKQTVDNSTYAPSITINIPGVVVREEADIELLSQRIATNVRRELSSRIG